MPCRHGPRSDDVRECLPAAGTPSLITAEEYAEVCVPTVR
ncbi:hypothetical protein SAMN05443668_104575 [Cryptosporangium aurantiacum]|uniref:Uncharacterized protein n=1 Tax=Cryptosporangium aurantiacum TaxID=134849 RepID=A0A1M7QFT9_9ACTN|nr:hypothetical protein SAMN05443668_104575 [Cryptosporangium aurantiacum]